MVTASLDMGAEKMVMALASVEQNVCRLLGIKYHVSQGMERGSVVDWDKVRFCIHALIDELIKNREIDLLNVALSSEVLYIEERQLSLALPRKVVEQTDLRHAYRQCLEMFEGDDRRVVIDINPVVYSVDGDRVTDPIGRLGRILKVTYRVYLANKQYLDRLKNLFTVCGIENIHFYPKAKAYAEVVKDIFDDDFALVDMGASSIEVLFFKENVLEYEASLPLGVNTIDLDIASAYRITFEQAKKLKHDWGQALRSHCKNRKVQIPNTNLTLESRDLSTVVQNRMEELLEGVLWLLQQWGFDSPKRNIFLTGGGSRLQDVDVLLSYMAGCSVDKIEVHRIQTSKVDALRTPEYLLVLGLLLCRPVSEGRSKENSPIKTIISKFFGI